MDSFELWEQGEGDGPYALVTELLADLEEVEEVLKRAERMKGVLRDRISRVLAHNGGKAQVGEVTLVLTEPCIVASYDRAGVDMLAVDLVAMGGQYAEIGQQLGGLRKESARAGSLRIDRARKGKAA